MHILLCMCLVEDAVQQRDHLLEKLFQPDVLGVLDNGPTAANTGCAWDPGQCKSQPGLLKNSHLPCRKGLYCKIAHG